MGRLAVIALCAAGCGRLGFDSGGALVLDALVGDAIVGDDAPGGDAMPGACEPPRKLCDDFEGAALDPRWMTFGGITLDTSRSHRGTTSLHAHTNALQVGANGYSTIWDTTLLPQRDPTLHVRVWMMIEQMPLNNMGLLEAIEPDPVNTEDGVFIVPGAMTVYSQFDERNDETPGPPALSTWLCLQWTLVRSQTNGSLVLGGDAGSASLQNVATEGAAGLTELQLGIAFSGTAVDVPQPPMDIWFDDLVVSTAPVGCSE